jgi:hypothetical protein
MTIEEIEIKIAELQNNMKNREITIDRLESEKRNEEWLLNWDKVDLNTLQDDLTRMEDEAVADEQWDGESDGFLEELYENSQFEGCDEMYGPFPE